jgi:hypothetical protein
VGGGAPRDGDGVPVAGVPEGGGEVARKLPRGNVVLVVCLAEAERGWSIGTTAGRSCGGAPVRVVERRKKEEAMLRGGMGKRS